MRVNISYSVELEEIPKKVISLVEEAHDQAAEAEQLLADAIEKVGSKNYLGALEEISKFRHAMGVVDFRMEDCVHILSGYSKTLADLATKETQPPPTTPEGHAFPPEQVAWVQDELRKLQEKKHESKPDEESG